MKVGNEYKCYVPYETSFFNQMQKVSYAKTNDIVFITEIDKTFVYLSNKRTNKTFYIPCCIFDKYFN